MITGKVVIFCDATNCSEILKINLKVQSLNETLYDNKWAVASSWMDSKESVKLGLTEYHYCPTHRPKG